MKKGEILTAYIEQTEFPNRGILFVDGKKMVVKNGLEGQTVQFRVTKTREDRAQGMLLDVVERSPLENQNPPCPHFGACGGCCYQTMDYANQLRLKEKQVDSLLRRAVPYEFQWDGMIGSPEQWQYRNKMEFSFGDEVKGGPLTLGLHKRNSTYDIIDIRDCRIVKPDYNRIVTCAAEHFRKMGNHFYHRVSHEGCLRHLVLRCSMDGEILVNLVTTTQEPVDEDAFVNCLLELKLDGCIAGILHTLNDSLADIVQSDETRLLYGQDFIEESLSGFRFRITPYSFFQTNSRGAEALYQKARDYAGRTNDAVIYDLYSGTGTIAQMLAPVARKVIGVEIVEEAVRAARENARVNGLDNCEFFAGDVLRVLGEIPEKPDMIVLDPPRDGIHPKALDQIVSYGVEQILYISCKPTSLVRDLETLQENGYRVARGCCVDMFPWTANVETVCLLSKLNVEHHIEVELNLDEMDLTAAEKKASYEEIKTYVQEHSGLKVSNLYIAQVKRKCGIIERENYNKAKAENARQPKCPKEKERAIREALEYFKMV